jgi:hypothetical protein
MGVVSIATLQATFEYDINPGAGAVGRSRLAAPVVPGFDRSALQTGEFERWLD